MNRQHNPKPDRIRYERIKKTSTNKDRKYMRHIILDTDVGIDDALALFLALSSPEIKVEAITTVNGNVPVEVSTRNALALLELTKRTDIPVARGCDRPLVQQPINAQHIHGDNGL